VVDRVGNSIDVTVYDDNGSVFATASTTDSSHTSGGVGFSFWGQTGGWDFYTVKEYTENAPTAVFGAEQGSGGATWAVAEDTPLSGLEPNENIRLRFSIQNSGPALPPTQFQLQYADKGSALNCESVSSYTNVPPASSCGSEAVCMSTSAEISNQADTAGLLSYPASMSFTLGKLVEDPDNATDAITVDSGSATEVEFNFQLTDSATGAAYCLRATDSGVALDNYSHVAEVSLVHAPFMMNLLLNNGDPISLTEGATTTVYATSTVTDFNGWEDIAFATSTFYRSTVSGGAQCTLDENNCYQALCTFSQCSGDQCLMTCQADLQYLAEPTDADPFDTDYWVADVHLQDSTGLFENASSTVDLYTLRGISIETAGIDFGALEVGQTSTTTAQTTFANTGNSPIDVELYGDDLTGNTDSIPVNSQKVATTTFAYASCAICQSLTGTIETAVSFDVDLPKPTSTSTPVTDDLFWGIEIPTGTAVESYSGTNYIEATAPGP
jgi:hypothetical protein